MVANRNAENVITAFHDFSVMITSYALESNSSWPNVTIPDYERRLNGTRKLAQAGPTSFSPIVQAKDRAGWEAYAVENSGWVEESQIAAGIPVYNPYVFPYVFDWGLDELGNATYVYSMSPGPYMPFCKSRRG